VHVLGKDAGQMQIQECANPSCPAVAAVAAAVGAVAADDGEEPWLQVLQAQTWERRKQRVEG
jgi:hypothetical protein